MSFVDIAATALAILACTAGALFLFVLTFVVVDEHGPRLDVPWREERAVRQTAARRAPNRNRRRMRRCHQHGRPRARRRFLAGHGLQNRLHRL